MAPRAVEPHSNSSSHEKEEEHPGQQDGSNGGDPCSMVIVCDEVCPGDMRHGTYGVSPETRVVPSQKVREAEEWISTMYPRDVVIRSFGAGSHLKRRY